MASTDRPECRKRDLVQLPFPFDETPRSVRTGKSDIIGFE